MSDIQNMYIWYATHVLYTFATYDSFIPNEYIGNNQLSDLKWIML